MKQKRQEYNENLYYLLIVTIVVSLLFVMTANSNEITYNQNVKPIFQKYCLECHPGTLQYETAVKYKDKILVKLVKLRQMPPKYVGTRPTDAEIELIKQWILNGTKK